MVFVGVIALVLTASLFGQAPQQRRSAGKTDKGEATADAARQAAALYDAAQTEHAQGNLPKAIDLYSQALSRDPDLWQAEFQRAAAYFALNKLAEAGQSIARVSAQLKQFADSAELRQATARVHLLAGEIALAEGKLPEAESALQRVLELNPQAARAHAGLAEVHFTANRIDAAITAARAALAGGDDRAAVYALLGAAELKAGKPVEAATSLSEALKRDSKDRVALRARAEAWAAQGKLPDAIRDLQAALALDANTQTKLRLGQLLTQARRADEANALYQQVLQDDPNNVEARAALTATMIDTGKGAEAIPQLEAMIKAEPNRAGLRAQLAELYLKDQPERALAEYSAAAQLEPAQPQYRVGAGAALVKLRRFDAAIAALRAALAVQLKDEVAYAAHANLATALFELDDFQNAAREFLWLLQHPREKRQAAVALYYLGICFDKLGDYEQALRAYEQFLSVATTENQLEIDKVKLRLPPLQRQIKAGQGKRKP